MRLTLKRGLLDGAVIILPETYCGSPFTIRLEFLDEGAPDAEFTVPISFRPHVYEWVTDTGPDEALYKEKGAKPIINLPT